MFSNFFICLKKNDAAADRMVEKFGPYEDDKCSLCSSVVISETANRELRKDMVVCCPDCFGEAMKGAGSTIEESLKESILVTGGKEYKAEDIASGGKQ